MKGSFLFVALAAAGLALAGVARHTFDALAHHMRSPGEGWLGGVAMGMMERVNGPTINDAVARLGVKDGERIVELGAGHGVGVRALMATDKKELDVWAVEVRCAGALVTPLHHATSSHHFTPPRTSTHHFTPRPRQPANPPTRQPANSPTRQPANPPTRQPADRPVPNAPYHPKHCFAIQLPYCHHTATIPGPTRTNSATGVRSGSSTWTATAAATS